MSTPDAIDKVILSSFKERLCYNSLDNKIVLYFKDRCYEYNNIAQKLRPFNSVLWYDLKKDDVKNFTTYLNSRLHKVIEEFEDTGYVCDNASRSIRIDNFISVDLDTLAAEKLDEEYTEDASAIRSFFRYIDDLYSKNESLLRAFVVALGE